MNNTKISIIIPVYNAQKTIERCLSSVVKQTYTNYEVLIINDGSVDNSFNICERFLSDERFKLFDQPNQGVSKTRNRGISVSTGDFICFVDSDDMLLEDYLLNYIEVLKFNENLDIVLQGIKYHYNEEKQILKGFDNLTSRNFVDIFIYSEKNNLNYAPFNKLFKSSIIKKNSIFFDEVLSFGEDYLFVLDAYIKSEAISFSKKEGYVYVMDANMNSLSKKRLSFDTLNYFAQNVKSKREELFNLHSFPNEYIRYNFVDYCELLLRSIHEHYLSVEFKGVDKIRVNNIMNKIPYDLKKDELKHFDTKLIFSFRKQPIFIQYLLIKITNKIKKKLRKN